MYSLIRPLLFSLPPETAHHFTLSNLQRLHNLKLTKPLFGATLSVPRTVMGLHFENPVGMAAGLDKNAEYIDCLSSLGFGFMEVGTVTPRPQRGNPTPRLFRLPEALALINRMGFNNRGVDYLISNVQKSNYRGILGINIGKNADTSLEEAISDYLIGFFKVYPVAHYVTINISSPNTEQLRDLQHGESLDNLLNALKQAQEQLAEQHRKYVPLVVKIAPDLKAEEVTLIAQKLLTHKIDGVIATNTTVCRDSVSHLRYGDEKGGLSGAPLLRPSTQIVQQLHTLLQDRIPIIASGGILTAMDAQKKIQAGASLVQIYTGLIYNGPTVVKEIVRTLQK